MAETTIQQSLEMAERQHRIGKYREAEQLYKQVLTEQPTNADAMQLLGVLSMQTGKADVGLGLLRRAVELNPSAAHFHLNLGIGLMGTGRADEAVTAFERTLAIVPDAPDAHFNLANALRQSGQHERAIEHYRRTIAIHPQHADAYNNLANLYREIGRTDDAITNYQLALRAKPDFAEALNNLGSALADRGRHDDAVSCYQRSIALKPNYAVAHGNLASEMHLRGQFEAAIAAYQRALQIHPNHAETHYNLGNVYSDKTDFESAVASYRRAIELRPDWHKAYNNLGTVVKEMGQLDAAIESYRRAIKLKPDYVIAHSNLIYTYHFHPKSTPASLLEEHRAWNAMHAEPLKSHIQPHANDRDPSRRIRIGYVSPDFRKHVVGMNLLPLVSAHDHRNFEIFCYADVRRPDPMTGQFKTLADHWRDIVGRSDEQVAELIRNDGIDILVDLTLHMAHNRMLVFARKPAPVQVTYLGYVSTTGLSTMDYRLTDAHLDPPGGDTKRYTERTVRLPQTYWCYQPIGEMPDVIAPPSKTNGFVTFGCFNNFCKVTQPTIDAWIKILRAVPESRLMLSAPPGEHLRPLRDRLADHDISPDRVDYLKKRPWEQYIESYQRIDIALDPFPYGGGITTCDSLFMGVPVVTLAGETACGRGGVSILNNIGLPQLIGQNADDYVQIAVTLAGDGKRLAELRSSLRQKMQTSPLMDAPRFAKTMESAYRTLWKRWCETKQS